MVAKFGRSLLQFLYFCVSLPVGAQTVTWSEDIAPIFYANCVSCHHDQGGQVFSLLTFDEAFTWSSNISTEVAAGRMPPWLPDPDYTQFLDQRLLTQSEIDLIVQWVSEGAMEGDTCLAPEPPEINYGAVLGAGDLNLIMAQPHQVPNDSEDFRVFVLPSGVLSDTIISGIEFVPQNKQALHHALYYLDTTGTARALDSATSEFGYISSGGIGFAPTSFLDGWVPGYVPRLFPNGFGTRIFADADVVLQVHFAPDNAGLVEQASLNVHLSSSPNIREVEFMGVSTGSLIDGPLFIPADSIRTFEEVFVVDSSISLLAVAPHMHVLGKQMRVFAVTVSADTIPLCWIPEWNFDWQGWLRFPHLVNIPAGSAIHVVAKYDNTMNNPENPNIPPVDVSEGSNTTDEMMLCYFFKVPYQSGDEQIYLGGDTASSVDTTVGDTIMPCDTAIVGDTTSTTDSTISLAKLNSGQKIGFEFYPNPVKNSLYIRATLLKNIDNVTMQLFDMSGRRIEMQQYESLLKGVNLLHFDLYDCATGTYLMVLMDSHGVNLYRQKLIID